MRYLTSTSTLLHDPALNRLLVSSIFRLFKLLTNELQRLGCTVVHASPDKLILFTNKKTIHEAIGYADFIERTLIKKEYFNALDFKFNSAWSLLLFYNMNNHIGIPDIIPDDDETEIEEPEPVANIEWLKYLPTENRIRESMGRLTHTSFIFRRRNVTLSR